MKDAERACLEYEVYPTGFVISRWSQGVHISERVRRSCGLEEF